MKVKLLKNLLKIFAEQESFENKLARLLKTTPIGQLKKYIQSFSENADLPYAAYPFPVEIENGNLISALFNVWKSFDEIVKYQIDITAQFQEAPPSEEKRSQFTELQREFERFKQTLLNLEQPKLEILAEQSSNLSSKHFFLLPISHYIQIALPPITLSVVPLAVPSFEPLELSTLIPPFRLFDETNINRNRLELPQESFNARLNRESRSSPFGRILEQLHHTSHFTSTPFDFFRESSENSENGESPAYINSLTFLEQKPIADIQEADRLALDRFLFDVNELMEYAKHCLENLYINPHTRLEFSATAKSAIKSHDKLKSFTESLERRLRIQKKIVTDNILDCMVETLQELLEVGKTHSKAASSELSNTSILYDEENLPASEIIMDKLIYFVKQLPYKQQDLLNRYIISIPHKLGMSIPTTFHYSLERETCIIAKQTLFWWFVKDLRPTLEIPREIVTHAQNEWINFNTSVPVFNHDEQIPIEQPEEFRLLPPYNFPRI